MELLNPVYVFLIEWDIPIYFIATIGILLNLGRLWLAQRQLRRSMFNVEREHGQRMRTSSLLGILLFGLIFGLVTYINAEVAPGLPPELLQRATPIPNVFATPLSSPTPDQQNQDGFVRPRVTPNLAATATLPGAALVEGDPAETPVPTNTRPSDEPETEEVFIPEGGGCTPGANISFPRQNMTVFGTVTFSGSATDDSFGAYEVELRGPGTGNEWVNVLGGRSFVPVSNGELASVDLGILENGPYNVRLTIVDAAGGLTSRCTISVEINNE